MRKRAERLLSFAIVFCAAAPAAAGDQPHTLARHILHAAGVNGGLVVHIGCGDGKLTAALRASNRYLVQGLDPDPANVPSARDHIQSLGIYGPVSIKVLRGSRLPYAENLVNLVVAESLGAIPKAEVMRVLAPGGVAWIAGKKMVKPRPADIDEWTHFLHDPSNNAVSSDTAVGPPRRFQWIAEPRRARHHENQASISAVVSAGGRIFAIQDEGSIASVVLPARWFLVARDAFNGLLLWKRRVEPWEAHLRPFRNGPPDIARALVATADRVFTTLGYGRPLVMLDAATGETLMTYPQTEGTTEVLYLDGILYVVVGDRSVEVAAEAARRRGITPPPRNRRLLALRAETGAVLWEKADAVARTIMPTTLAAAEGRLFFQNHTHVVCLDARSGKELWRADRPVAVKRPPFSTPTLVVHKGVVLSADRATPELLAREPNRRYGMGWVNAPKGQLIAFDTNTGKRLWQTDCREVFNAPVDVLVVDDLVWTGELVHARDPGITRALDLRTGQVRRSRPRDQEFYNIGMPHHRCHRNRATSRYILTARAGVEFIDVRTGVAIPHHWVRGTCQFGTLPANGLLYAPPHSCACYLEAKLNGFLALAPGPAPRPQADEPRLVRGPAYGRPLDPHPSSLDPRHSTPDPDWPTYRHDPARSGASPTAVPATVRQRWATTLGGSLTAPTVAAGKVFVASRNTHILHALHAATGKPTWRFTAGGRIDSPPTVARGLVVFGCADGWVYCLRAGDGELVWQFRAAPRERQIVVRGQLESAWPVHGNVLVRDGQVWCAAGRSSYLDGGIRLLRLQLATGSLLSEARLDSRDPSTGHQRKGVVRGFDLPGALPDVLSSDGQLVYMRHLAFDLEGKRHPEPRPHLFSPTGLLDGTWWHRSYWILGTRYYTGYRDWFRAGHEVPSGQMLVFAGQKVYGYGRRPRYYYWTTPNEYELFATTRRPRLVPAAVKRTRIPPWGRKDVARLWSRPVPLLVRAMVLAGASESSGEPTALFIAGPPALAEETKVYKLLPTPDAEKALAQQEAALAGKKGGLLLAVAPADGRILSKVELRSPPVWDGLAAAGGNLYLTTMDGTVTCFGSPSH